MKKIILSVNSGSSSVKVSVFLATQSLTQIAEAQIDGLTAPPPKLKYNRRGKQDDVKDLDKSITSQEDAFRTILDLLISDKTLLELSSQNDVAYTTHRVVHGGDYDEPKVIDNDIYNHIKELSDLAPLYVSIP
jgi:acetate kinase